jgi:hypothetical protein
LPCWSMKALPHPKGWASQFRPWPSGRKPTKTIRTMVFWRLWCVWQWCDVSSAGKYSRSTTSRSYWEPCISACCWWEGELNSDDFRMPEVD